MGLSGGIRALLIIRNKMGLSRGIRAPLTIKSKIGLSEGITWTAIKEAGVTIFG